MKIGPCRKTRAFFWIKAGKLQDDERVIRYMSKNEKKPLLSREDIMKILDACYDKCLHGIPKVNPSVEEMAGDYLRKYNTKEPACKSMLKNQITKCATSGFITGYGGLSLFL